MAITHQIIKYRLNPDGTVPDFLCLHQDGVGGVFLKADPTTAAPQDNIMVGLSEYEVTSNTPNIVGIITSKNELNSYLIEVLDGQFETFPDENGNPIPIDVQKRTDWVWETYCNKNGISTT